MYTGLIPAVAMLVSVSAVPASGATRMFDYRQSVLDNGLRVITVEDFSCPIVAIQLWYHVGSKDESPERNGFAHMFEHMMFRGNDRLGPKDHFEYIRRVGGRTNAYTSFDQTVYHEVLPANQLDLGLWLEAERMGFLKIDQTSFDTERQVVEEERRLGANRPYGTLNEKVLAELYKVHPYRWDVIGNIAHLRAASVPELREFWMRYYVPNNATLVIAGAVSHDDALAAARRHFGWLPKAPEPPRVTVREPEPDNGPRMLVLKEDNAPAPLVGIGTRTVPIGHEDEIPLRLLAAVLAEGTSSRLYRELVAEKELAVGVRRLDRFAEQDGIWGVGAALPPVGARPDDVLAIIAAHLERVRSEPVTDRELMKARNQMLKGVITGNLRVWNKAHELGSAAVLEGDPERANERIERIRRVTAADVQRVAAKYLAPRRLFSARVERNLLGSLGGMLGLRKEEAPPVTARPETTPAPPGRPGLRRPEGWPERPPLAPLPEVDAALRYESATLANGLRLMVVSNSEVPFVTARLNLRAGAWTEQKPGTVLMATEMLTRGTRRHTEASLAEELETYAIGLGGWARLDAAGAWADFLTEHADRAVRLLADAVRTPTFPPEEFRKLARRIRTELVVSTSEPSYLADRELARRLYGPHPYARSVSGEPEDIDRLEVADAGRWWAQWARPDSAVLVFAGDITLSRAQALAERYFGDWKAEGPPPGCDVPPIPEPARRQIYLVDRPGIQAQIRVGCALPLTPGHPAYFTSLVVGEYFGGTFSARLNETIRVKKGLTYGARGGFAADRFGGRFWASTFTKNARAVESVRAIFDEISRLRTEPPTPEELQAVKSSFLGGFAGQRETPQAVAEDLWYLTLHGLPAEHYSRLLKAVAATEATDCMRLIGDMVDPDRITVVVVGPAAELKAGLEAIAPVTIVQRAEGADTQPATAAGQAPSDRPVAATSREAETTLDPWTRHYYERLAGFRRETPQPGGIVLVGSSHIEGFNAARYLPGRRIVNRGIAADHIGLGPTGVIHRLEESVFDCRPGMVILENGVNDLGDLWRTGRPAMDQIERCYRDVVKRIRSRLPDVPLVVVGLFPTRDRFAGLVPLIVDFNQRLERIAREHGCTFMDVYGPFADPAGLLREDLSRDGLHLNDSGYRLWAQMIEKLLPAPTTAPGGQ